MRPHLPSVVSREVDPDLWVRLEDDDKKRYFLQDSPKTFPGWVTVIDEQTRSSRNVPANAILSVSYEAFYWLCGYLLAAEPSYEFMYGEDYEDLEAKRQRWLEALTLFRKTGFWRYETVKCESCERTLLPSEPHDSEECQTCGDLQHEDIVERWYRSIPNQ